jgi:hypothetical protein
MKNVIFAACMTVAFTSCAKKEDKAKSTVNTKLRSTGTVDVALLLNHLNSPLAATLDTQLANSAVDLEYFKVPIGTIALTQNLGAEGGFTGTSPMFYTCPSTDESECLVDLADDSLDTLLEGDASVEFETGGATYNGVTVQHCMDYEIGDTFDAIVKGTVTLGAVEYFTNAETGLSTTGPAEDAAIPMKCMGSDSYLLETVTVAEDSTVNLVLYAEPNGAVFATDNKTLANSNCAGDDVAICSNNINVFGTVDDADPTIERYLLATEGYSDAIMTLLVNSDDEVFGASMSEFFVNATEERLLGTPTMNFSGIEEVSSGKYDISYGTGDGEDIAVISNFERKAHSGTFNAIEALSEEAAYTATVLE